MMRVLVAAMGSEYRRDDGVGVAAAKQVRDSWSLSVGTPDGRSGPGGCNALGALGDLASLEDGASRLVSLERRTVSVVSCHDPLDLLGRWDRVELAVVLDATRSGAPAGSVVTISLEEPKDLREEWREEWREERREGWREERRAARRGVSSTHAFDVVDVFRLALATGTAPRRLLLVGIEGADFGEGEGLTPAVAAGAVAAADAAVRAIEELDRCA